MDRRTFHLLQSIAFGLLTLFSASIPFVPTLTTPVFSWHSVWLRRSDLWHTEMPNKCKMLEMKKWLMPRPKMLQIQKEHSISEYIYISLVAFPLLTLLTISDLNDLESGATESALVWGPIAFVYAPDTGPRSFLIPLAGIAVISLLYRKMKEQPDRTS